MTFTTGPTSDGEENTCFVTVRKTLCLAKSFFDERIWTSKRGNKFSRKTFAYHPSGAQAPVASAQVDSYVHLLSKRIMPGNIILFPLFNTTTESFLYHPPLRNRFRTFLQHVRRASSGRHRRRFGQGTESHTIKGEALLRLLLSAAVAHSLTVAACLC